MRLDKAKWMLDIAECSIHLQEIILKFSRIPV